MKIQDLVAQIKQKKSFLCVGLDPDLAKMPPHLLAEEDPIFAFNKQIIDATVAYAVAYKPNIAFYEAYGLSGWKSLEKTIDYLNSNYPEVFTIADAKRGDIGNTSRMYASAFLEKLNFDSITVAPYMGKDSVEPFLSFENKHCILLALTSNEGATDFQLPNQVFEEVIRTSQTYDNSERLMYVVGATKTAQLAKIRELAPEHFLLVPGVGAQGGSLEEVCQYGMTENVGLLINSSRGIIYASQGIDFEASVSLAAQDLQKQMEIILKERGILYD